MNDETVEEKARLGETKQHGSKWWRRTREAVGWHTRKERKRRASLDAVRNVTSW